MWAPVWFFCVSVSHCCLLRTERTFCPCYKHTYKEKKREGEKEDKVKGRKEKRVIQGPRDVVFS